MGDRMTVVNASVMTEDVMDVTHKEVATGDDLESMQMGKGAGFHGDLFNEKLREIDSELEKFDLEKEITAGTGLIVEMEGTINGKSNYCGIVTGEASQELAACENMEKKYQHVRVNEGSPNVFEHHVVGEKTKQQENKSGVAVNAVSTWKRIVRKETNSLAVVPPLKALKRLGTDLLNFELPKKKKQISHNDQDTKTELAGSDIHCFYSILPKAMNILCWNCCGLGNPQTVQEFGDLIRAQDPLVVFLAKTWLDKARLEEIKARYKFKGLIEVSRISRGGGWLFFGKRDAISPLIHIP